MLLSNSTLNLLRLTATTVNTTVVMGAVEGIVTARDVTKLRQHDGKFYGGHINIIKSLARSLLIIWDMLRENV